MSYAEYQNDGTLVNSGSILSAREFYQKCGITAARKKYETWNGLIQTDSAELSQQHYKYADWARTLVGIQRMLNH